MSETKATTWFEVDRDGLRKTLRSKGIEFLLYEPVQNAWDEIERLVNVQEDGASDPDEWQGGTVNIELIRQADGLVQLSIVDNSPDGFKDLAHAYTLFAESDKKADPRLRGRFNVGEKFVLAFCKQARLETVKGTVIFGEDGTRHTTNNSSMGGTMLTLWFDDITDDEFRRLDRAASALIPPDSVTTIFQGREVPKRLADSTFVATLPTEIVNDKGVMTRTARKTYVEVHTPLPDEVPTLYECGIPVAELTGGEPCHINGLQKVPLNVERDKVSPSFLQKVRTAVLNNCYRDLDDLSKPWVSDAMASSEISEYAMGTVLDKRFGEKRVAYDPSDQEANKRATAAGYTVVPGGSMSSGQWENTKRYGLMKPAGQVTPSPKPFHPDGTPLIEYPESEWDLGVHWVVEHARRVGKALLGRGIRVVVANESQWCTACYGGGELHLNFAKYVKSVWREPWEWLEVWDALLLHEFAHEKVSDHLSDEFHTEVARLGAKLASLYHGKYDCLVPDSTMAAVSRTGWSIKGDHS